MATFTRRELIDQAASKIGALGAGQVLTVEDLDAFEVQTDCLFDQLAEDGILTIGDEDEIPASWCPYLSLLLANLAAPDYGAQFSLDVKVQNEAVLRRLVRAEITYEHQVTEYF